MTELADEALADWSLLLQVIGRLTESSTTTATLQALRSPAPAAEEGELCLWTVEDDPRGAPEWLTLVGVLPARDRPARGELGERHHLPDIPFTQLCLASPGVPVLISSVDDDPRIDPAQRGRWRARGVHATILLALCLRGRISGMMMIHWPRPLPLGPRELRMYQVLSRSAALLLDNMVMVARLQASLAETTQQRRLLETVLDHVPVGILCIEAPSRRPLVTNRMARLMLTGSPDPVSSPLPLAHMLYPGTDEPVSANDLAGIRAARTGVLQRVDLDLVPPGGPRMAVETVGAPVRDEGGKVDRVVVVMTDITARKQAAEERARLQDQVIRAQAAALVERSTPLIPITDDILVMPLIGTIDRERGQSILETALEGARQRRARVTILDITGVPSIDEGALAVLTDTAGALRLLGVTPILSGVRPAVAQALAQLGVSMAGILTCGSLQAGVTLALQRLGKRL